MADQSRDTSGSPLLMVADCKRRECSWCARGHLSEGGEHWIATGFAKIKIVPCTKGGGDAS